MTLKMGMAIGRSTRGASTPRRLLGRAGLASDD